MAHTYRHSPFELVVLPRDTCDHGTFEDRFERPFVRPMRPLIVAGVGCEFAIGNHDNDLRHTDERVAEIEAELRLPGTHGRSYASLRRPVDCSYLDSSVPGVSPSVTPQAYR